MRTAPLLGGLALLLALGDPAATQTPTPAPKTPEVRYVTAAEALVRAGPSERFYPTNLLHPGDKVQVVEAGAGGWLAIRPPEGSFSWINTRFLQNIVPHQPNYVVAQEGTTADVVIGSSVRRDRPDVVGAKLQRGTQVRSLGPTQTDCEGTWMPIEPPPGEVRYIQADAVSKVPPAPRPSGVVTASSPGSPAWSAAPAGPATPPPPPPSPDALWRQAQQAERNGQTADAIRLYNQAGTANLSVNPARSMEAFERARWLEQTNRYPGVSASTFIPTQAAGIVPASEVRYTTADRTGSPATVMSPTIRLAAPSPAVPTAYSPPADPGPLAGHPLAGATASSPGLLKRSRRASESQPVYVLMPAQGGYHLYATPQPGLNLEPYVNQNVRLLGTTSYRGDLKAYCITVSSVQPMP